MGQSQRRTTSTPAADRAARGDLQGVSSSHLALDVTYTLLDSWITSPYKKVRPQHTASHYMIAGARSRFSTAGRAAQIAASARSVSGSADARCRSISAYNQKRRSIARAFLKKGSSKQHE